ncbi:hypothetical protein LUX57_38370 [Actinomadura madurae]|uniref:hypothetical protein n=1 Tax=Actinomadura madurae TaxID=1993 RepID=UPI0020D201D0|nr:hypothetical protein [Actinomadura madurae]MCP9970331.1 hypothetical protein [Actinomadura madurae]
MPAEWRGTTVQVCGLWPFGAGSGTPMMGVPLGRELTTGAALCCDPISWFQRANLIHNPSALVLGKPGLGKSTLIRRMVLGLVGQGVFPMVLGDLKPDYVDLIRALGGQIIKLGRGLGSLNVLDPGATAAAAARLPEQARTKLVADAHGRRLNMVAALLTVLRGGPIADTERTVLNAALRVLDERYPGVPTLPDLITVIDQGPERLRSVTLARGDEAKYRTAVDPLHASLLGVLDGPMGRPSPGTPPPRSTWTTRAGCASTSAASTTPTPNCRPPCCWRAGRTGSVRWRPRTRWPMRAWNHDGTSSSCWTSCGGCCGRDAGWSTGSTR